MKSSTFQAYSCHDDRSAFSFACSDMFAHCAQMQYVLIYFVTEVHLPVHLHKGFMQMNFTSCNQLVISYNESLEITGI